MPPSNPAYIFINCPYDRPYLEMFQALVFTIMRARYVPRCTLENSDCSELRLPRIVQLISECSRGIHDISRVELDPDTNLPRFNMPFELGLFFGAKHFGGASYRDRPCLICEGTPHSHDKYLSDVSGCELVAHKNSIRTMIRRVWAWLSTESAEDEEVSAQSVHDLYLLFKADFQAFCEKEGDSYLRMPYEHYVKFTENVTQWLKAHLPQ